ncbi:hypothetical protein GJ496_007834 [Pomphorhynchus laevis]|nr:hypothetical protein GJ496_007834 [Pomphorhynchus laevis]
MERKYAQFKAYIIRHMTRSGVSNYTSIDTKLSNCNEVEIIRIIDEKNRESLRHMNGQTSKIVKPFDSPCLLCAGFQNCLKQEIIFVLRYSSYPTFREGKEITAIQKRK